MIKKMTVEQALNSEDVTFDQFHDAIVEIGNWCYINSEEMIMDYIKHMMGTHVHVSHILKALETNWSKHRLYKMDLGYSLNTPEPINTKEDLINALELDKDDLQKEIKL